jgi:hypothetical protein
MITTTQLAAEVRRIAAERPGDVYVRPFEKDAGCYYWHRTKPGCIVGQALFNLGVPGEKLAVCDDVTNFPNLQDGTGVENVVRTQGLVEVDDEYSLSWLTLVQESQDNGTNFAAAVEYADNETDGWRD